MYIYMQCNINNNPIIYLSLYHDDPHLRIYVDGKQTTQGELGSNGAEIPLNGTLYLGQDQDRFDGGFDPYQTLSGFIAQVRLIG